MAFWQQVAWGKCLKKKDWFADTYKQSMLKAFTKTVEQSRFPLVIIDASNIQVEDFKPAYMVAQVRKESAKPFSNLRSNCMWLSGGAVVPNPSQNRYATSQMSRQLCIHVVFIPNVSGLQLLPLEGQTVVASFGMFNVWFWYPWDSSSMKL